MLMVDDVYVGPKNNTPQTARKRLGTRALRSPANPNESFEITLDGVLKGVTDGYSFLFEDIAAGKHTASVKAKYLNTESEPAEYSFEVPGDCYADVTFNVTADSKISADGTTLNLVNITTSETFSITVGQGKSPASPYLPQRRILTKTLRQEHSNPWNGISPSTETPHSTSNLKTTSQRHTTSRQNSRTMGPTCCDGTVNSDSATALKNIPISPKAHSDNG